MIAGAAKAFALIVAALVVLLWVYLSPDEKKDDR